MVRGAGLSPQHGLPVPPLSSAPRGGRGTLCLQDEDGELSGVTSLVLPWNRTWGTSKHFSLQKRAGPSLPSTSGRQAGPVTAGTRGPRLNSVPGPAPQLPAISGQLLQPQVPGNSPEPYKKQQARRQQHSGLLREKHNGSEDARASEFTRVPKPGARIRASYKGDAKQPPHSIPVTSRLTGAAFHAAALRGNLIHFLIRRQLPPAQRSQMGGGGKSPPCYTPKPRPGGLTRVLPGGASIAGRESSNLALNLQEGSPGPVAKSSPWRKQPVPLRSRRAVCTKLSQDAPERPKPPETQAGGGQGVRAPSRAPGTVPAAQGPQSGAGPHVQPPSTDAGGVQPPPRWLSAAEAGCTDQLPGCLRRGSKPPPQHHGDLHARGFIEMRREPMKTPPAPPKTSSAHAQHWEPQGCRPPWHREGPDHAGPRRVAEGLDPAQGWEMLNPRSPHAGCGCCWLALPGSSVSRLIKQIKARPARQSKQDSDTCKPPAPHRSQPGGSPPTRGTGTGPWGLQGDGAAGELARQHVPGSP